MARDWRKVALAAFAAAMLASVCPFGSPAHAQQAAKAGKTPEPAAKKDDGDEEQQQAPAAAAKKKRQDPAEAQRTIDSANKLLQAGKSEQAAQTLTGVLAGGNLPPAMMARALYLRGIAHRQQAKPAQAISDLTSALWLKGGLAAEDRQDALKQRSGAYADAGLTESGEIAAAPAPKAPSERPPAGKGWGVETTPAEKAPAEPAQTAGGGNWFKNWFNNASPAQANAAAPPSTTAPTSTASIDKSDSPPRVAKAPAATNVGSAWSSKTEVQAAVPAAEPPRTGNPHHPATAAVATGKYRVQLAAVRTQQEAVALAAKAKRALAGELAAREPEIDQAVLGNMGSFYRVRVGPFGTLQETQAVCAKIKGTGFDCMTVTQ